MATQPSLLEAVHALAQAVYRDPSQFDDTVSVEVRRSQFRDPKDPPRWTACVLSAEVTSEPREPIGALYEAGSADAALMSLGRNLRDQAARQVAAGQDAIATMDRLTADDE